jgi:hypothetical protein
VDGTTARLVAQELQLTESGARGRVAFHGTSMYPFLREADEVLVAPVGWADIRPGDVVTFRLDDRFPTYRVVRRDSGRLVLRGDNWPDREFHVWPEDVLGRAIARRRDGVWLSRDEAAWRGLRFLALARYRAALVRRRLRARARGPYAALRRLAGSSPPWVRVEADKVDPGGVLAAVREARLSAPTARLDVRLRSDGLTPAVAAELMSLGVARVVVTLAPPDAGPSALEGVAGMAALRRQREARVPLMRIEYRLDPASCDSLVLVVRAAAAAGVDELLLTGQSLEGVVARGGGARLKQAVKLAEAHQIALGRPGLDRIAEILS